MARSVSDAAIVLSTIAGPDPNDNYTLAQPDPIPDFSLALKKDALAGIRIGVPRTVYLDDEITGNDPSVNEAFEKAIATIRSLGATVIDPADMPSAKEIAMSYNDFLLTDNETFVLRVEFKASVFIVQVSKLVELS